MGTFSDRVEKNSRIFLPNQPNGFGSEERRRNADKNARELMELNENDKKIMAENLERRKKMAEQSAVIDKFRSSFIENDEEELEAKRLIEEHLGFEVPRVCGYHMVVKIYVRPEDVHETTNDKGEKIKIYLPEIVTHGDKFKNCTALVLNKGPECYTGKRFEGREPWCRIGDWVIIARNAGPQVNYRGIPVTYLPDDQIYGVVSDPNHVTRD